MAQTLRTLGYYVEPPADPISAISADAQPISAGLAPTLQWLLITLYQELGKHTILPIDLPWAVLKELRAQLTPATSRGRKQYPGCAQWLSPTSRLDHATHHRPSPEIRTALAQGKDIEIRYWGPADGHSTTRRITPYWIEERHQMLYLIGWCHLRQEERTFRVDRIEAVVSL